MQVHYTRKSLAKIQVFNWERRKKATTNVHLHSLATLFGTPCQYWVGPTFAFRTAVILHGRDLTRCWKHSSEILVHFDMIASRSCCRFVGCTSMMWISRSTTSQRCSIGLRSGDCGGHLSKVNSLSCSRNQSEIIWTLRHQKMSSFWNTQTSPSGTNNHSMFKVT